MSSSARSSRTPSPADGPAATTPGPHSRAPTRRTVFLAATILAGVATAVASVRYPVGGITQPGPGFFPLVTGVALAVVAAVALAGGRKEPAGTGPVDDDEPTPDATPTTSWVHITVFALVLVGYVILLDAVGQIVASVALLVATLLLARARPLWQMVLFAVGLTAVSFVVFDVLLNVPLPTSVRF